MFTRGVTQDLVGHGRSEGERCLVASVTEYVEDVLRHLEALTAQYPATPLYLLGHSMGGLIATQVQALCSVKFKTK